MSHQHQYDILSGKQLIKFIFDLNIKCILTSTKTYLKSQLLTGSFILFLQRTKLMQLIKFASASEFNQSVFFSHEIFLHFAVYVFFKCSSMLTL